MSAMSDDKKDERRARMLAALSEGMTWEEAADRVGVSDRTLYRWCRADPDLAQAAAKAREGADDMVEAVTFGNCLDPDAAHNSLRMFWLKSRRPEVYRETTRTDLTSGGKPVNTVFYIPANGRDANDPPPAGAAGNVAG